MHILFVDDTVEITDLYRLCFSFQGHTTETAYDGTQALSIIEQKASSLDVVFIDYNMPGITGLDVVRKLRQREVIPCVPIILFTGAEQGVLEAQAQELNVARIVYKPLAPQDLLKVAVEVIGC